MRITSAYRTGTHLTTARAGGAALALVLGGWLVGGCTGTVVETSETVATLTLTADAQGALLADACTAAHGAKGCTPYPNELGCQQMTVDVQADGRTYLRCEHQGRVLRAGYATVADGAPFLCKANSDLSCQLCKDLYGNTVIDTCNRGAQMFRSPQGGAWGSTPGGGSLPGQKLGGGGGSDAGPGSLGSSDSGASSTTPKTTPPAAGGSRCDPNTATTNYAKQLNAILAKEGLKFTWSPSLASKVDPRRGFWGYNAYRNSRDMCQYWLQSNSRLTQCWSKEPGKCHCVKNYGSARRGSGIFSQLRGGSSGGSTAGRQTCRCARINVFALRRACQQIPKSCANRQDHVAKIVVAYGAATRWLFSSTYGGKFYGGGSTPQIPQSANPPRCLGSPLVLDLAGDGVHPTGPADGVTFDLVGHGRLETGWIAGDDALLVLDRNGNGKIDDGTELFGEATDIGGAPAADGFAALAALDRAEQGGNGDGVIDERDAMFGELQLWRDKNGDGKSQSAELAPLSSGGVSQLSVHKTSSDHAFDGAGNDLGLRGRFTRSDGRPGLMVDVLFATGR